MYGSLIADYMVRICPLSKGYALTYDSTYLNFFLLLLAITTYFLIFLKNK